MTDDTLETDRESLGKRLAVGLVVTLLFVSVIGATTAIALDRTALDGDYVADTLESENSYADLTEEFRNEVANNLSQAVEEDLPVGIEIVEFDPRRTANESVPESHIAAEFRGAITGLYGFLHGDSDRLEMRIDLVPVRENLQSVFDAEKVHVDTPVFVEELTASAETDPLPTDSETITALSDSRSSYEAVRLSLRVDVAFESLRVEDPDRLLDAVIDDYDPDEYTEPEKQQEIDAHEEAIRDYLETALGIDDELAASVEATLAEFGSEARGDVDREAGTIDQPDPLTDAAGSLGITVIDGLVGDMTFDEYRTRLQDDEATLEAETATAIQTEIEGSVPEEIDLSEGFGGEDGDDLDEVAFAFGIGSLSAWLLPILSVLLIGAVYGLTRQVHRTALTTGKTLAVAGGLGIVVGYVLNPLVRGVLSDMLIADGEDSPSGLAEGGLAVLDGSLSQIGVQSVLLFALGLLLVGVVIADRRQKLDGLRTKLGLDPYSTPTQEEATAGSEAPEAQDGSETAGTAAETRSEAESGTSADAISPEGTRTTEDETDSSDTDPSDTERTDHAVGSESSNR